MATAASPVAAAPASAPATRNVGIDAALTDQKSQSALVKLLFFTFLMVSGPIGTYFLSLKHVWGESNTTHAAVSAAIVANLVVFAYIVTALREDQAEQQGTKSQAVDKKKQ